MGSLRVTSPFIFSLSLSFQAHYYEIFSTPLLKIFPTAKLFLPLPLSKPYVFNGTSFFSFKLKLTEEQLTFDNLIIS